MDYIGSKCPVCQKYFHADEDIVVCPECGTPHHRSCYEQLGHCANAERHAQGYDYTQEQADSAPEAVIRCPSCGKENDKESFFCKFCGSSLTENNKQAQQPNGFPFGAGFNPGAASFLDPLGGVPGDTDFGFDVTAGEAAKYVKQNTPYFIRIFSNIKNLNKSKFNFAAALFMGGYMLYRKMYKIGAVITLLQLAIMIFELYLSIVYQQLFADFAQSYANASGTTDFLNSITHYLSEASATDLLILYLPTLLDILRIVMMIVIGACFNRLYMKHCQRQIAFIKEFAAIENENPETLLQTRGGVNTALAVSLLVSSMLILYLPRIIAGML